LNSSEKQTKKVSSFQKIMEYVWIVISIFSLALWIYSVMKEGFKDNFMLLIVSGISFLMFSVRRYLRRNAMKQNSIMNHKE
jgi:predicted phage tail protein